MIKRIVKLTFQKDKIEEFKEIFRVSKTKIIQSPGCHSVELLQSTKEPHIFFTYSIWTDEEFLNRYRHSSIFQETWSKTKLLFSDKPQAWSVNSLERIMG